MTEAEFTELIDALKVDIRLFEEIIQEVAGDIIKEGFSEYPIFIATEHDIKLGEIIVDKNDMNARFSMYATTLEEMLEKNLVLPARKAEFIKAYKNPKQFICVMLITNAIASFVFVPYSQGGSIR